MADVSIRKLSDEVHRAIRQRAATHGRSAEAEMRAILSDAVQPPERVKLGSLLFAGISEENRLTDDERETYFGRDRSVTEPVEFGR